MRRRKRDRFEWSSWHYTLEALKMVTAPPLERVGRSLHPESARCHTEHGSRDG